MNSPTALQQVLLSDAPVRTPKRTAIMVISGDFRGGEKALKCLANQTAVGEMEMTLATDLIETLTPLHHISRDLHPCSASLAMSRDYHTCGLSARAWRAHHMWVFAKTIRSWKTSGRPS